MCFMLHVIKSGKTQGGNRLAAVTNISATKWNVKPGQNQKWMAPRGSLWDEFPNSE